MLTHVDGFPYPVTFLVGAASGKDFCVVPVHYMVLLGRVVC